MWAVGDDTNGAGLASNCVQILVTYNQVEWILAVHDKYQFLHSCEMSKQQDGEIGLKKCAWVGFYVRHFRHLEL